MICALLVFQTTTFDAAARSHLAVARHAHPRARRRGRRPRRADAPPVHQDAHAARRTAVRRARHLHRASAATPVTSRSRGTTTWRTWTSTRCSAPARRRGRPRRSRRALSRRDPGAPRLGDRALLAVGRRSDVADGQRRGQPRGDAASPLDVLGGARPPQRRVLPLRRPEVGSRRPRCARLAAHLDISVPEDLWPELVDAATFERMRAGADRIAPDTTHAIWQDNQQFFHRGRERPVARAARRRRPSPLQRAALPSWPSPISPDGCTAKRSWRLDRPADLRARPLGGSGRRLDRAHPLRSAVRPPEQAELSRAGSRARAPHHRGRLRRRPRRPRAPRARAPRVGFDASPALARAAGRSPRRRFRSPSPTSLRLPIADAASPTSSCASWCSWTSRISTARSPSSRVCLAPGGTLCVGDPAPDHDERALRPRRRVPHVLHGRVPEDDAPRARHQTQRRRDLHFRLEHRPIEATSTRSKPRVSRSPRSRAAPERGAGGGAPRVRTRCGSRRSCTCSPTHRVAGAALADRLEKRVEHGAVALDLDVVGADTSVEQQHEIGCASPTPSRPARRCRR